MTPAPGPAARPSQRGEGSTHHWRGYSSTRVPVPWYSSTQYFLNAILIRVPAAHFPLSLAHAIDIAISISISSYGCTTGSTRVPGTKSTQSSVEFSNSFTRTSKIRTRTREFGCATGRQPFRSPTMADVAPKTKRRRAPPMPKRRAAPVPPKAKAKLMAAVRMGALAGLAAKAKSTGARTLLSRLAHALADVRLL